MLLPTWERNVKYIQYYPILHLGLVKNEGLTIKLGIETAIITGDITMGYTTHIGAGDLHGLSCNAQRYPIQWMAAKSCR
jgi:hypothetical protein